MLRCFLFVLLFSILCPIQQTMAAEKIDVYSTPEYIRLKDINNHLNEQNQRLREEVKSLKNVKVEVAAVIDQEDKKLLQQAVDNQQKDLLFCKYGMFILAGISLFLCLCLLVVKKK